jgi:hypothetical protein
LQAILAQSFLNLNFSSLQPRHIMDESCSLFQGPQQLDQTKSSASASPALVKDPKMTNTIVTPRFQSPSTQSSADTMSSHRHDIKPESNPAPTTNNEMQFHFVGSEDVSSEEEGSIDRKRNRESKDLTNEHKALIEDIYNVERREDQPKKRVKTTDTETTLAKSKSQFHMSGNGGLGEYMKEGRQPSEATTPVVDLTIGA